MKQREEFSVAAQKASRPQIGAVAEHFITDPVLKEGLTGVLLLLDEHKIKMGWFHTSHYKSKYKGELIVDIKIAQGFHNIENWLSITVIGAMDVMQTV